MLMSGGSSFKPKQVWSSYTYGKKTLLNKAKCCVYSLMCLKTMLNLSEFAKFQTDYELKPQPAIMLSSINNILVCWWRSIIEFLVRDLPSTEPSQVLSDGTNGTTGNNQPCCDVGILGSPTAQICCNCGWGLWQTINLSIYGLVNSPVKMKCFNFKRWRLIRPQRSDINNNIQLQVEDNGFWVKRKWGF